MELSKKEVKKIILVAFIAAFVLTFDEWGIESFDLIFGLRNLMLVFIFTIIIYFCHAIAQKLTAEYFDHGVEFDIYSITKRINEVRRSITIPLGPIITLLFTIATQGKLFLLILNTFNELPDKVSRLGRKWTNIKEFEIAQIALSGPLSQIILLMVFKILSPISDVFYQGIYTVSTIAIFNMLPIPKIDGIKIFSGSRTLYITSLIFIILFVLLVFNISVIQTFIISLILSLISGLVYFYKLKAK